LASLLACVFRHSLLVLSPLASGTRPAFSLAMSSEGSGPSRDQLPVTLLDQAEAAVDICQSFNKCAPIKVTPNGSAAVGLLVRKFKTAQPEAFKLASALGFGPVLMSRAFSLLVHAEERQLIFTSLLTALSSSCPLEKSAPPPKSPWRSGLAPPSRCALTPLSLLVRALADFAPFPSARQDDKRIAFESRYDQWQHVVLQLKPKWLDGTTTISKTDRIEIRRPAPTSLLLYLLYDVVTGVERLSEGSERLHCALSVLYIFSLLVLPRQPDTDSKHVELKFSHSIWRESFDRHLRGDEAHRERYKKVRALLRDETLKAGEELHDWARWLVETTGHPSSSDGEEEGERARDERVDVVVGQMTAFLQKVHRMIVRPSFSFVVSQSLN